MKGEIPSGVNPEALQPNVLPQKEQPQPTDLSKKTLERMYIKQRKSCGDIARELGIKENRAYWKLRSYGIPRRSYSQAQLVVVEKRKGEQKDTSTEPRAEPQYSQLTEALLRKMYEEEKKSWNDIAQELGVAITLLTKRAALYGIQSRSRSEAQKAAWNKSPEAKKARVAQLHTSQSDKDRVAGIARFFAQHPERAAEVKEAGKRFAQRSRETRIQNRAKEMEKILGVEGYEAQKARLSQLAQQLTDQQIAEVFHISVHKVEYWRRLLGITRLPGIRPSGTFSSAKETVRSAYEQSLIDQLSEKERLVVDLRHYTKGRPIAKEVIGGHFGVSKQMVDLVEKRALKKLGDMLQGKPPARKRGRKPT